MTKKNIRQMTGLVVSSKRDKTITVLVERKVKHPIYKKIVRRSTKLQAHDEANECSEGDIVTIEESKPFSKTKSWKFTEVEKRVKNIS
jgi:small subunit ribosomal protein S17|tara:strand:- start:29 stop:292 length:264 start_codon:yes stop_codon:yes gene_type:complete